MPSQIIILQELQPFFYELKVSQYRLLFFLRLELSFLFRSGFLLPLLLRLINQGQAEFCPADHPFNLPRIRHGAQSADGIFKLDLCTVDSKL